MTINPENLTVVRRYDTVRLDKIEITPQGFLKIPVYAARTGVQTYRKADGSVIKEFRPKQEVFSEKTMRSLAGIPFTNDHPTEMLNPKNTKSLSIGYTSDVVQVVDGKFLKTDVTVYDEQAIRDIQNGKVEVSAGYDVELESKPGVFEGEAYDVVQKNIVHNHLALVDKARGGRDVRLRLDSQDAAQVLDNQLTEDEPMKVKIGDKEFDLPEGAAEAVKGLVKAHDNMAEELKKMKDGKSKKDGEDEKLAEELKTAKAENEKLTAKVDSLTADLEEAKKAPKEDGERMDAAKVRSLVRSRQRLEKVAAKTLKGDTLAKLDSMDDLEVKKEIIKTEAPEVNFDGKTEVYIDARYDHIAEKVLKTDDSHKKAADAIIEGRKKDAESNADSEDPEVIRKKAMDDARNAWKQPVGKTAAK